MYAYEKLIQEHDLNVKLLPADAQSGIQDIQRLNRSVVTNEKLGKNVSATKAKIRTLDKWVTREILEFLEEEDEQNIEKPISSEEVTKTIEAMANEIHPPTPIDPNIILGKKIDSELDALAQNNPGVTDFDIDEVASKIPTTHKQIFDHYEDGGQNGVRTPNWEFIETSKAKFSLKKR